jgi:diadenosine tetraphosphate (Ap4A) HIT family hydrolase
MGSTRISPLPGGVEVAFGGTRTAVKLDRPWQLEIPPVGQSCPFEREDVTPIDSFETVEGWRLLQNKYTPFPWHRLLVPASCWSVNKIRQLGGPQEIECVLSLTQKIIGPARGEFWLGVHVGLTAGQNVRHLHYHLLKPLKRSPNCDPYSVELYAKSAKVVLFHHNGLKTALGGLRAGQCFIVPEHPSMLTNPIETFANALSRVIDLYNERFRSVQGLSPDFMTVLKFKGNRIQYASYIPILNNWGFTEYLGIIERTPLILPWPHESTAAHLKML